MDDFTPITPSPRRETLAFLRASIPHTTTTRPRHDEARYGPPAWPKHPGRNGGQEQVMHKKTALHDTPLTLLP